MLRFCFWNNFILTAPDNKQFEDFITWDPVSYQSGQHGAWLIDIILNIFVKLNSFPLYSSLPLYVCTLNWLCSFEKEVETSKLRLWITFGLPSLSPPSAEPDWTPQNTVGGRQCPLVVGRKDQLYCKGTWFVVYVQTLSSSGQNETCTCK